MPQPAFLDRTCQGDGLRGIADHSLHWLRPAYANMLEATKRVGQDATAASCPESGSLNPAHRMTTVRKKAIDYLTGQNTAVRLALIDQNTPISSARRRFPTGSGKAGLVQPG